MDSAGRGQRCVLWHGSLSNLRSTNCTMLIREQIQDRRAYTGPNVVPPTLAQEVVLFEAPNILCRRNGGPLIGLLDDQNGKIVAALLADEELRLQLNLSKAPTASEPGNHPRKGTLGYLQIIVYGPKRCLNDVGDFVTQCGCFLDDPIGCEWNVPYINPQCLSSLYEQPIMTFDLSGAHPQDLQACKVSSSDVLAEFETLHQFAEARAPAAL